MNSFLAAVLSFIAPILNDISLTYSLTKDQRESEGDNHHHMYISYIQCLCLLSLSPVFINFTRTLNSKMP